MKKLHRLSIQQTEIKLLSQLLFSYEWKRINQDYSIRVQRYVRIIISAIFRKLYTVIFEK